MAQCNRVLCRFTGLGDTARWMFQAANQKQ